MRISAVKKRCRRRAKSGSFSTTPLAPAAHAEVDEPICGSQLRVTTRRALNGSHGFDSIIFHEVKHAPRAPAFHFDFSARRVRSGHVYAGLSRRGRFGRARVGVVGRSHPEEAWGVEDPRLTWVEERNEWIIAYKAYSSGGPLVSTELRRSYRILRSSPEARPFSRTSKKRPRFRTAARTMTRQCGTRTSPFFRRVGPLVRSRERLTRKLHRSARPRNISGFEKSLRSHRPTAPGSDVSTRNWRLGPGQFRLEFLSPTR